MVAATELSLLTYLQTLNTATNSLHDVYLAIPDTKPHCKFHRVYYDNSTVLIFQTLIVINILVIVISYFQLSSDKLLFFFGNFLKTVDFFIFFLIFILFSIYFLIFGLKINSQYKCFH